MKSLLRSFVAWQIFAGATCLAAGDAPVMGTVELTVRGPDGKTLATTPLVVTRPKPPGYRTIYQRPGFPVDSDQLEDLPLTTDDAGRVSFGIHLGQHRLSVQVPGVGYGNTGLVAVEPDVVAKPPLPPLMPFGSIEGRLPQDQAGPGRTFNLPDDLNVKRKIVCEADGRFRVEDLRLGSVWIRPYASGSKLEIVSHVYIRPGQQTKHVGFRPEKRSVNPVPITPSPNAPARSVPGAFAASGTVRDLNGRPIADADVMIVGGYFGGMRMSPVFYSTKSDAEGRWRIDTTEQFSFADGDIVAHKAGYAYTAVQLRNQFGRTADGAAPAAPSYDLVLSPHGGTLEVTLLQDGTPLSNVPVKVVASQSPSKRLQALNFPSQTLRPIVEPILVTDERGVATFTDLPPDNYRIIAIAGDQQALAGFYLPREFESMPHGWAEPVPVHSGRTKKFSLVVTRHPRLIDLRLNTPDGRPTAGRMVEVHAKNIARAGSFATVKFDDRGFGTWPFARAGIWSLKLRYGVSERPEGPSSMPPYHEAAIALGVSPLLPTKMIEPVTATLIEPGSLEVRLEDAEGRPTAGYVQLDLHVGNQMRAGSTDEAGSVRFDGEPEMPVEVSGFLKSRPLPSLGFGDEPFADDAEFIGHQEFLNRRVRFVEDVVTQVTLRAVKVGYVRGLVHPAAGRTPADYYIEPMFPHPRPTNRYNAVTGEFICGPLPLGEATIILQEHGDPAKAMRYERKVEVRHESVARIELNPSTDAKPGDQPGTGSEQPLIAVDYLGQLNRNTVWSMHGVVTEADGTTPAWGAQLFSIEPGLGVVAGRGYADTAGRFIMKSVGYTVRMFGDDDYPTPPRVPTFVALQPGSARATIVEITKEMREREIKVKLPPAIGALGRLTVDGKSIAGRTSTFRIVATHEIRGAVGTLLDVETQPDADGNFELAGLSPGKYFVQASMDGIWLSKPISLTIDAAQPKLPPLDLDIGAPGKPTLVRCIDGRGMPVVGVRAALVLPLGPLAEKLLPSQYQSDGAGAIHLPPLEAGTHVLKIDGHSIDLRFEVAPLGNGSLVGNAEPNRIIVMLK